MKKRQKSFDKGSTVAVGMVEQRERLHFLVLFLASLAVRLIYLHYLQQLPQFSHPIMDEGYHLDLARRILTQGYPAEPYFRGPVYLYLLAVLQWLTGESLYWTRVIQVVLGSLLPVLMYSIGRRLFDNRVALVAAGIAVVYPTFLYHESLLLVESVMTVVAMFTFWLLLRCEETDRWQPYALAGASVGLAALTRANMLVLIPMLAIWIWLVISPRIGVRMAWSRYAVLVFACLAVIAPVTIRNYVVGKDSVLIAWQGGINFYLGNNRGADGWSATAPGMDKTWMGGYNESFQIAEQEAGRALKFSEVSDYWYDRGWQEIFEAPQHALGLAVTKLRLLFNGYEIPNNEGMYVVREFVPFMRYALFDSPVFFPFGLIAPLALIGIGLSLTRWRTYLLSQIFIWGIGGSLLLFFVCSRFRQPIIPLLILFAVYGAFALVSLARRKRYVPLVIAVVICGGLLLESNHQVIDLPRDQADAQDSFNLATAYQAAGNDQAAEQRFRRAVQLEPDYASAYNNLGILAHKRNDLVEAERCFRQAIRGDSLTVQPYLNLAIILRNQRRLDEVASLTSRAAKLSPYSADAQFEYALSLAQVGEFAEAMKTVEKALALNPNNPQAALLRDKLREKL